MKEIINAASTCLQGLGEIDSIYLHTYRKQQNLTIKLVLSQPFKDLSDKTRTTLTQRAFVVDDYDRTASITFPYAAYTHGYGDDLDSIPNRTLHTWSERLVDALLDIDQEHLLDSGLVNFYWNTGRGRHSLGTNLKRILKLPESAGQIVGEIPLEYDGTLALCEHALVYYDGKDTQTIMHRSIEKIEFASDEITLSSHDRAYEFKALYEGTHIDKNQSYFKTLIEYTYPGDIEILSQSDIPKDKSVEYYVQLFGQYYQPGDSDPARTATACEIAKVGMNLYPQSMRLLDSSTKSFLLSGNIKEQYQYFKKCAEYYTGHDSYVWKNLIANTINSVVVLNDTLEMAEFYNKHYQPEHEHSPRIYFHNMACLIVLLDKENEFEPCMEKALARSETASHITGETDFAGIRSTEAYQRILYTAISQDKQHGENKNHEVINFSVYDYIQSYRLNEFHSLDKIAKERHPQAEEFLQTLALDALTSSLHRQDAFYLLVALAGNENLEVAKKSYDQFGSSDMYDFCFNMDTILTLVDDKDKFQQDLTNIMGDDADDLLEDA